MTNPTSNFGWQMPTSTDLVTDLPADFETFGQAVDTSLAELKGGTTGQVLSKTSNTDMDFTWVTSDDANAIQNTIVDAKGDLIAASASDVPARLAVGNNGETLVADSSQATGLRYTALFGANKNKIINGDFGINQRVFTSVTTNSTYTFDRWITGMVGSSVTYTPQTFTPGTAPVSGYESTNYLRIVTASQSAVGDFASIAQRIEDVRTFANQTITVSFWAKAGSGTPLIGFGGYQSFGSGGSGAVVLTSPATQAISTSWARYTFNVTIPSISGKTVGADSFLQFYIFVSAGSNLVASGYPNVGLQNGTFDIWGVQAEAGSVATVFQTATGTIQGELAACQRYYFRSNTGQTYSSTAIGGAYSTTGGTVYSKLPVTMRVKPYALEYANQSVYDFSVVVALTNLTISANESTTDQAALTITVASGLIQFRPLSLLANNNTSGYIGLSAEL
jgi:hypothetical protein